MCIFSMQVKEVSATSIFARSNNGSQFLVYRMTYAAAGDLAMVLPLPVPANPPEDAIRFINLERYPDFFDDMARSFRSRRLSLGAPRSASLCYQPLAVHDVGDFEASFVPKLCDFERLDERFQIPADAWDKLPAYHDYGFAVFKLKATSQKRKVHPMAFEFPRRNPDSLYFPTIHIHDGEVHSDATFDHSLYCQVTPDMLDYLDGWRQSEGSLSKFMSVSLCEGVIDADARCWSRSLTGRLENKDSTVGESGSVPVAV